MKLSKARRVVRDVLRLTRNVPIIPIHRRMSLARLVAARDACAAPPPWSAIFIKGYGLLAEETAFLRQAYLGFPWGRIVQYRDSIAVVAVERQYQGEWIPFQLFIHSPASLPLGIIGRKIREAKSAPVTEIEDFRNAIRLAGLPVWLRRLVLLTCSNHGPVRPYLFGTFGMSTVSSFGSNMSRILAPVGTLLTYGTIDPDGSVEVSVMFDHRIIDGAPMARALARFEDILNGVVAEEIAQGHRSP